MEYIKILIAKDFSKTPGPRYKKEGSFSAELFLEQILEKKFTDILEKKDKKIIIDLDGTLGYGTSFLEETFGGLARKYGADKVSEKIEVASKEEPWLLEDIKSYIEDVKKQS
ncbi:MAG: DUF4325 domain-containing protein [Candidatus Staskawiczbacteria bacterium RIFOXYD1_FULL_39_28]|uniref:DUF4325 domain-containing protein n=1 Tax=Candidatus Staskawiczbacteria bacterium RIFOXYC1_FULL_38_18 TaxID=1802229 RepID=A0A1G2JDP4_9BACT|nr:MAG: DUF4325 domain-containing protein [Candidatus Staskawiczbacteria bacterium RIFOXYC1_FULL_38_18]OGZ91024.1 MAG: DUF4325 domain-containing protein [Candidatus Staskawiczbacteria bacterium RIFOXYD1_FULL_39_28]